MPFIATIILFYLGFSLFANEVNERWSSFVYPSKSNLSDSLILGTFETFQECQIRSTVVLDKLGVLDNGTYECGLNCRVEKDNPSFSICEKTESTIYPWFLPNQILSYNENKRSASKEGPRGLYAELNSIKSKKPLNEYSRLLAQNYNEPLTKKIETDCIFKIYDAYESNFLTYIAWIKIKTLKVLKSFNIPISTKSENFYKNYVKFQDSVQCLQYSSDSIIPTLDMSPQEFKVTFNQLLEYKKINLTLDESY